eukprot:2968946-Pleurochrysis_carterae.AAC.1
MNPARQNASPSFLSSNFHSSSYSPLRNIGTVRVEHFSSLRQFAPNAPPPKHPRLTRTTARVPVARVPIAEVAIARV